MTFFEMNVSGTTVDINTMGTLSIVTGSYHSGKVWADIEVNGHEWSIQGGSGGFSVGNLDCIPLVSSSGFMWGYVNTMVTTPWRVGQTLKHVTGTFHSTVAYGDSLGFIDYVRCEMSYDHAYFSVPRATDGRLKIMRLNTWNLTEQEYDPSTRGNHFLGQYCIYNNNIIYTMEWDSGYDFFYLVKVVFNPDGTVTYTEVYESPGTHSLNMNTYIEWDLWHISFIKHGNTEAIVCVETINSSPSAIPHYALAFYIYTISTDDMTVIEENFSSAVYDFNWNYYFVAPSIYEDKLIITFGVWAFINPPVDGSDVCGCPTYIVNATSKAVAIADNLTYNYPTEMLRPNQEVSAVDYDTGKYYFLVWRMTTADFDLVELNITSAIPQLNIVYGGAGNLELFQGYPKGYAVERPTSVPQSCAVKSLPGLATVATVWITSCHGAFNYIEGNCFIDGTQEIIWNVKDSELEGKDLGAGTNRNISLDWGADIPWDYSGIRHVFISVVAGQMMIGLHSTDIGGRQSTWYLMKQDKPCGWP